MQALIARPLDGVETAVVGCVDVLERTGDSLTAAWRMPLSIRQSKEAAFHLELSPDPRLGGAIGSPDATAASSLAVQPGAVGPSTTAWCADGVRGASTPDVCCAGTCGQCGGPACGTLPGGRDSCCTSNILRNNITCADSASMGCIVPGWPLPGTRSSEWSWREVAGGMHGVHLVGGLDACAPYALRLRVDRDNRSAYGPIGPTTWTMCPPAKMEPPRVGCVAADGALLLWDAARSAEAPATTYRVLNVTRNGSQGMERADYTALWQGPGQRLWLSTVKVPPLAVPQLAPCASAGRA